MFPVTDNIPANKQDEQVDGQKYPCCCRERPPESGHQVADKGSGNNYRPRRYDADRDRIEKLTLSEPVVIENDPLVQERDDGKTAAKGKRPGLDEKASQFPEKRCGCREPGKRNQNSWNRSNLRFPASWRRVEQDADQA